MTERAEGKGKSNNRVLTPGEVQRELFPRVVRKPWQGMTFRPVRRSDERPDEQSQQNNNQNSRP